MATYMYEVAEEVLRAGGSNKEIQRRIMSEFPNARVNIGRAPQFRLHFERYGHCRLQDGGDEPLESLFHDEMLATFDIAGREAGYYAYRFLAKVKAMGGVQAARSWLRPGKAKKPEVGFLTLMNAGKLHISMEALVLKKPWDSLFTSEELNVARVRLKNAGFFDAKIERAIGTYLPEEIAATFEGTTKQVLVNVYERSKKARAECLRVQGTQCFVCDFDFEKYGKRFRGMIHVHHLVPLGSIGERYRVNGATDLIPVCPNCHAVIHSRTECYGYNEVREMLGLRPRRLKKKPGAK